MSDGPKRQLTLLDCFGLGINGIIGSGIFLLPATLYRRAGGSSPLAWLAVGGLCTLVALCFAEAAGRTDRSGGPYRFACDAFGPHVGFVVGWITLVSSMLGYAAVSRGFATHAVHLLPDGVPIAVVVVAIVVLLGALNILGLKPSARTGDVVSFMKIAALLAFIAIGLLSIKTSALGAAPAPRPDEKTGIVAAAFAGLFACTGFEYVPVPAGETRNPQRAVGLAMVVSVVGATLLYALIQLILVSASPGLASSETPLVDGARDLTGPTGGVGMGVVAVISAFGFCSGSALIVPRYVESFAQDGFLPSLLSRRMGRASTPVPAILLCSAIVAVLGSTLDFRQLADTSNIAVVVQYVSTSVSVLVQRRRDPGSLGFRIPLGPLVPLLAIAGSVAFVFSVSLAELELSAVLIGAGLLVGLVTRSLRRNQSS
jgi:amino acid transporter